MSLYAVNGKTPVAAWIPSRDTAGNGTATLTDLVGTNHGTLTNMDPATDWVADTGAGGVRALDFDGVNDFVNCGDSPLLQFGSGNFAVSLWFSARVVNYGVGSQGTLISKNFTGFETFIFVNRNNSFLGGTPNSLAGSLPITTNDWFHALVSRQAGAVSSFINGNLNATSSNSSSVSNAGTNLLLGSRTGSLVFNGRLDDIRIFNTALDAADVAYLYNGGNGRGRIASVNSQRRRTQQQIIHGAF